MERQCTARYVAALLAPSLILSLIIYAALFVWRTISEYRYDKIIIKIATEERVDPALVKAVVWKESSFRQWAVGRAGEVGLMQITKTAFEDWKKAHHAFQYNFVDLFDAELNIRVGTWVLSRAISNYLCTDNPIVYGLAAYNAGPRHVQRWATGQAKTNSALLIQNIDLPITRSYIPMVVQRAYYYRQQFKSLGVVSKDSRLQQRK